MKIKSGGIFTGRNLELFSQESDKSWGYAKPQTDTFAVLYPKDYKTDKSYPLCVVFHSAGHDVYSALMCLQTKGNHDIYHVPDNMFGLFLDCRANAPSDAPANARTTLCNNEESTDWWWGGRSVIDPEVHERASTELQPVEKRILATVEWVTEKYGIDRDRIYAVGNSMGGSGALGIAMCRGDIFAAVKVNVAAGVYHMLDRCGYAKDSPEDFTIPDPPVAVELLIAERHILGRA